MSFTIGRWDIAFHARAKRSWNYFKRSRYENGWHFVWGRFSLSIEDWTDECFAVCAECGSPDVGEQFMGDEGWTVCQGCCSVEQGYRYVNKRDYENAT